MTGQRSDWAARVFAFLGWLPRVNRENARRDLVAGLTGAVVVLPQGVAFATIAGLPPEYGLYTAMVPAVVAALFGSSWHLVSGPTTAISIVVYAVCSPLAEPGTPAYLSLALTLTFLVGAIQLGLGLARTGTLIQFVSHTVVIGFTAGAAVLIATSQLRNFFGVDIPRGSSFGQTMRSFLSQLGAIDPYVTAVGAVTLLTGILFRRTLRRFPYLIAAMLLGSVAGAVISRAFGPAAAGIRTVGALPGALPPLSHPDLSIATVKQLGGSALALALLALTEAVSIARAIAVRSEQRIDGNREFVGQGLSNVVGSFFSSYASSGSFNRSGLNYEAGARTPLAAIFAAFFLVAILLLVAPLAAHLPVAAMAGILFLVAWGLIDLHHIRAIVRVSRSETVVLVATFLSTLILDLEFAIYVGVVLSVVMYLRRTSQPLVDTLAPDLADAQGSFATGEGLPECPQLKIVEVHGSLFFGAVSHVQQVLHAIDSDNPEQKHVLVVASSINFTDVAGAEMLVQEARRRRRMGGGLYLAGVKPRTMELLRKGGYLAEIGEENVFDTVPRAIEAIEGRLDRSICQACRTPVFERCSAVARAQAPRRRPTAAMEADMAAAAFAEEGDLDSARRIMAEARRGEAAGPRRISPAPGVDDEGSDRS